MTKHRRHRPRVLGHGVLILTKDGPQGCLHGRHERCDITGMTGKELEQLLPRERRPTVLYEAKGHAHSGVATAAYRRNWDTTFKN